jgi:hypothetical protein
MVKSLVQPSYKDAPATLRLRVSSDWADCVAATTRSPAGYVLTTKWANRETELTPSSTVFLFKTATNAHTGKPVFSTKQQLGGPNSSRQVDPRDMHRGANVTVLFELTKVFMPDAPAHGIPLLEARKVYVFPTEEQLEWRASHGAGASKSDDCAVAQAKVDDYEVE